MCVRVICPDFPLLAYKSQHKFMHGELQTKNVMCECDGRWGKGGADVDVWKGRERVLKVVL